MDIYVKLSSDLGSDLGPSFSVASDVGSIIPTSATKAELLSGKLFNISNSLASNITITSIGACSNSASFNIDKDVDTCYAASAFGYQPGQTRPTDENGAVTPFNTEMLSTDEANELIYVDEGTHCQINIFGKNIIFNIDLVTTMQDGSTVKLGTVFGDGGLNNGEFDASFSASQSMEVAIYFYDAGVAYTIEGDSSSGFVAKEWAISDLISGGY